MTDSATITFAVVGLGARTNPNHIPVPAPVGSPAWRAVQASGLVPRKGRKERAGKGGERSDVLENHLSLFPQAGSPTIICLRHLAWIGRSDPIPLLRISHYLMYFFMCLLVSFLTEMHSPNIFMLTNLTALLWIFSSLALLMFSRLSDQSCTQCPREKSNSDLYKGTAVPLVIFRVSDICIQRTVPPILESLRTSQGLMMRFTHCLLECAVVHSWRTALGEYSLLPSFCSLMANTDIGLE